MLRAIGKSRIGAWLIDALMGGYEKAAEFRAAPQQAIERQVNYLYAPHPRYDKYLYAAATNTWVYTAVSRLAERFTSVAPEVVTRKGNAPYEAHPLNSLLGRYGRPNEYMDSLELLNQAVQHVEIYGNAFWYFAQGQRAGYDFDIYPLQPEYVFIQPSSSSRLGKYLLIQYGKTWELDPSTVVHFKRPSMNSVDYYGQSASEVLFSESVMDNSMRDFNQAQFSDGIPNGLVFVDYETSDADMTRIADELAANHKDRRRVGVLRMPRSGKAAFFEGGMNPRDMDFKEGRLLSRQAVYDAFGFHVGLLSEASTEAHARVAERQVQLTIWTRHNRFASVLNQALDFWSAANRYHVRFPDVRQTDWEQESKRLASIKGLMTVNEIRATLSLPPVAGGDTMLASDENKGSGDDDNKGDGKGNSQKGEDSEGGNSDDEGGAKGEK